MNNLISAKQTRDTAITFMLGSVVLSGSSGLSGQDSWLAIIIGCLLALPLAWMYARILSLFPGRNLFDISLIVFGKVLGKLLILIYTFYAIHLGSLVMRTFTEFVVSVNMPETPEIVIMSFLIVFSVWIARSGVEVMARISSFVAWIVIGVSVLTFILALKDMTFDYIKPVLGSGLPSIAHASFLSMSLPFGEIILIAGLANSFGQKTSHYKTVFSTFGIFLAISLVISLRNLLVLGVTNSKIYYYPSYESVSVIALGEFLSRIEVLTGMNLLLAGTVKMSVCVLVASIGLSRLFEFDNPQAAAAATGTIMIVIAVSNYKNSLQAFLWTDIYPIYVFPYQVILPVVILIGCEIKSRVLKVRGQGKPPQTPSQTS